jgi:hypothetical protein
VVRNHSQHRDAGDERAAASHDLGTLPPATERRSVLVYVRPSLLNPFGHWEYQEQDVQVVDLIDAPALRNGDSLSFTTTVTLD